MAFDIIGAKNAGYSDTEIADFLSSQAGFDAKGARTAGYSDQEIIGHVSGSVDVGAEAPKPTRIFSTPSKGTQQDVMGIASPKDRQAAETAQVFVKNDIPAVAKTFGAKIGGGMEQSLGGAMRAYGEENTNRFNVDDNQLAQTRAGRYLNELTAADDTQRAAIAQRGTELGNEGRAVIQAAQEDQPVQTRAGRILDQTAQSIGSNLPGMAATMVTGSPAVGLSMMGLQSFGQTYDESRAKGLNIADATMNAAIQGGTEVATEMLPFVALSKYLKTGNLSKEVVKAYLSDIPGEQLATTIQNASGAAYDKPDMTPQQRIDAAADYLVSNQHKEDQIDTFFTTILQNTVMAGVAKTARAGNALAPAAQPAPSGPLSRAVGMAEPATMSQVVGPPEAVEPVQVVADIVAQRRGGDKSAAKRRFVGTPAPIVPVMAENQGIAPVEANMPELQGNPDAQISPVAGLPEPVDTLVSPISQGVAPISPTIGVSNETADDGRQDEYAQGTESNADGEGQGRDEAALQTVQRDEDAAQNETGVAPATRLPANSIVVQVNDRDGNPLDYITAPHDGTPEGMHTASQQTARTVAQAYPDSSFRETIHLVTDDSGTPTGTINPRFGDISPLPQEQAEAPKVEAPAPVVDKLEAPEAPIAVDETVASPSIDAATATRNVLQQLASPKRKSDTLVATLKDAHGKEILNQLVKQEMVRFPGQGRAEITKAGQEWLLKNPAPRTQQQQKRYDALANKRKLSDSEAKAFEQLSTMAPAYSTNEKETREDLTLERVQSSFPSLPVSEDNGAFTVTTPSGIPIRISKVGEIEFGPEQRAAAEKEYGRKLRDDERPVAEFKPLDHGALINLTEKGVTELPHEVFHLAMNLALTERQKAAVLRTFGNEEKAAAEYQRLKESGALETRKGNYWLAKIYRFLRSLRQLIAPTAKGVMEDVASGKVWGKAHAGGGGARYAAAWHGSPHDFDKFKSSAIGTGEGAQAYGHGIYFASNRDVAEYYKNALSEDSWLYLKGKPVDATIAEGSAIMEVGRNGGDIGKTIESLKSKGKTAEAKYLESMVRKGAEYRAAGRLYQVELAPSEDEYLLWDKPLSEQSEKVKAALDAAGFDGSSPFETGEEFYRSQQGVGSEAGQWSFKNGGISSGQEAASNYLHSLGIRGIKYLDGTSRGSAGQKGGIHEVSPGVWKIANMSYKGYATDSFASREEAEQAFESTRNYNYVIFNDEDVEIKAKYSLRSAFTSHNPAALKSSLTVHPKVQALVGSVFNNGRNVTRWQGSVGTMYHMAEKLAAEGKPQFKAVFDKGQEFLTDVSTLALKAESLAPDIFPKMGTGKGLFHNLPRKDAIAIAEPLYQGTLFGGADPKKGKVFSDTELKRIFNLSEHQIELYKQARAATDQSLDDMAKSLIARNAKEAQVGFDREMDLADMAAEVKIAIQDKIDTMKSALDQLEDDYKNTPPDPDEKAQKKLEKAHNRAVSTQEAAIELHESFINNVEDLAYKTDLLKKRGYFPLMRFGQYKVTMKDHSGKVEFFGLFESAYKARLMTDALQKENAGMSVVQSVMGREKFKLFAGMNLEGLQLFAEHMKAEDSEAYQEYLKQAMNNRSAMKRLIHRKGTEGYSDDAVRTLANFITSNARHAATQYHLHDMRKLAADVPEDTQGDVQDQAVKLYEYLSKPVEEASKLRGYLFFHYLGGSLASGIVNMTQPVMMTMPYLASKTTAAKAAKHLTKASKMSFTDPAKVGGELGVALRRAESEGVTAPQEIYQLTAMASNKLLAANPYWNAGLKAWGGFFSVAEAFNRRVTFIASFRISREKGLSPDRAYTEAVKAITETQGIYNKGNRPKWGRGTVGGTLFTFKQFSVMYLELFNRLPSKQKGIMLGILWLMAGLQGMPFAEDAEDIIDTIGQWAGFATNSKRWINQQAEDALGKDAGDFVTQGISSVLPLDLQGRMGLQNLIPGTGILKQSATDKGRDVKEFFGPAGGLLASLGDALTLAAQGLPGRAALSASPRAVQNIAQGVEMMATGAGHDKYGRKTVELSPGESAMKLTGFNPSRVAEEGQVKSANMQDVKLLRVRKNEISTQWAYGIAHKDSGEIAEAKKKLLDWNAKNPELKMNMGSVVQSARQKARALNTTGKDRFLKSMPKEIRRRVIDELG